MGPLEPIGVASVCPGVLSLTRGSCLAHGDLVQLLNHLDTFQKLDKEASSIHVTAEAQTGKIKALERQVLIPRGLSASLLPLVLPRHSFDSYVGVEGKGTWLVGCTSSISRGNVDPDATILDDILSAVGVREAHRKFNLGAPLCPRARTAGDLKDL